MTSARLMMDHYTEPTEQGSTPGDKHFFDFFRTIALVPAYRRQELKRDVIIDQKWKLSAK